MTDRLKNIVTEIAQMSVAELSQFVNTFGVTISLAALSALVGDIELVTVMLSPNTTKEHYPKIHAIKLVRELTGWGLRESKDFVDSVVANQSTRTVALNVPRSVASNLENTGHLLGVIFRVV